MCVAKIKGVDQLCCYYTADLRLCFRLYMHVVGFHMRRLKFKTKLRKNSTKHVSNILHRMFAFMDGYSCVCV